MSEAVRGDGVGLTYEVRDRIAYVSLNRPRVLNALNHALRRALVDAVVAARDDDGVRVLVLQGSERAFSAGQDQNESAAMSASEADTRITDYGDLFAAVRDCEKPTIAKVDGYAAGAGFQLALHCDLRYCTPAAKLGMTELRVGSACITGTQALSTAISDIGIRELVLLGEFIGAERARELGLVTEIVPRAELDARVHGIACELADRPPLALSLTKRYWRDRSQPAFDQAVERAHAAHAQNYASGNLSAAAAGFLGRDHD